MREALNKQLKAELFSSNLYLSLAGWFESQGLTGFSAWFKKQAEEERAHGMMFFKFILDRNARPEILAVEAPQKDWRSAQEAVAAVHAHEKAVTEMIHSLHDLAAQEGDKAAQVFLHELIKEQVEEEAASDQLLQRVKLAKDGAGLLLVDRELAKRASGK